MPASDRMQLILQAMASGGPEVQALQRDIDSLLKSFGKIKESTDQAGKTAGFEKFAAGVKEFIQSPLESAGNFAEGFLKKLGPIGTAASVAAAGFGLFAKASYNAAKELGAYGDRIGDTAIRLGMSAKEVGQFSFAMKRAGGDIASVEMAMRTLSKGMSSFDDEGKEVRQTLSDLGITTREPKEALVQLAAAFSKMEDTANRNTLAIRLFGRSALELLPDLMELPEGLARAAELNLGPSEAELKRWSDYQKQIVEVEAVWDRLKRKAKEPIAATFLVVTKTIQASDASQANLIAGAVNRVSSGNLGEYFEWPAGTRLAPGAEWAGMWSDQLSWTKASSVRSAERIAGDQAAFGRTKEGLEARLRAAEKVEAARREEYFAYTGEEKGAVDSQRAWQEAAAAAARYRRELEAIEKAEKDRKDLLEATQKVSEASWKYYQGQLPTTFMLGGQRMYLPSAAGERFRESPGYLKPFEEQMGGIGMEWSLREMALGRASGGGERKLAGLQEFQAWYADQQARMEQSRRAALDHQIRMTELVAGPGGELAAAREIYELRMAAAKTQEESAQAAYAYEEQIAQVNRERLTAWRNTVGSAFDSLVAGGAGAGAFLKSFGVGTARTMVQNLATSYLKPGSLAVPGQGTEQKPTFLGTLLRGTPFGLDTSTVKLDASAMKLSLAGDVLIRAGNSLALGGFTGGAAVGMDQLPSRTLDVIAATLPYKMTGGAGGLVRGLGGFTGGAAVGMDQLPSRTLDVIAATLPLKMNLDSAGKYTGLSKALGAGGALAAGALGAYSGFSAGGAQGALTGASSIVSSAGLLLPMISGALKFAGPVGLVAGLGLGVAAALMGNPKEKRREQLENERLSRGFTEPSGSSYLSDLYGREVDYSYRGGVRVYKTVVINAQVDAMDASSFRDFARSNDAEFGAAVTSAITSGNAEGLVGTLREVL